jgi:acyl-CoA thioester hydrolase
VDQSLLIEPRGELLVSGETKHVWVNQAWRPVRIDKEAPDLYKLITG